MIPTDARPGDLVFFWGTGFLSWAISHFTGGFKGRAPSHVGMIIDPKYVSDDGAGKGGPYMAESTILGGIDGVQVNSLPLRATGYSGSIALCRLRPTLRSFLNFGRMTDLLYAKANHDTYNKLELGEYLLREVPLIQYLPDLYRSDKGMEVCSELVTILLAAGGLPGLNPATTAPQGLLEMAIFDGEPEWIVGPAMPLTRYNSL
jgi:hypothetical protein